MAEYSHGTVRVWHGKWQGMLNYRESPNDKWKRKTKVLRTYHEADPEHIGRKIERQLPEPSGRVTKAMTQLAEISLREWREELVGMSRINDPNATVGDYLSFYLDTVEKAKLVEQSTMGQYRCIERFLKKRDIAYIPLLDLCQEDVEKFVADMVDDSYKPGTVRKYYNMLHGAIKHAVSARTLPYDPCMSVRLPKNAQEEPNSLDAENRAKLVSFLRGAEVNATTTGICIALFTGMREGEVCGLRWKYVDLDGHVIHVRNVIAHYLDRFYEKEPKTRASRRDIPFDDGLSQFLGRRLGGAKAECEVAGVEFDEAMYVIGSVGDGTGAYMKPRRLWSDWKAVARSLGLVGMRGRCPSFHDLRHTYATVAVHLSGTDLKNVQVNLGHASVKTTLDIYASDDSEARRGIAQQTAAAIGAPRVRQQDPRRLPRRDPVVLQHRGGLQAVRDGALMAGQLRPCVFLDGIPQNLQAIPRWICWCAERRGDKMTKIPKDPRTSANAKSTDPSTWADFETAVQAWNHGNGRFTGIGFIFGDDSAADLALCNHLAFWCAKDEAQMDRIFRSSALMREKWDTRRGSTTYGQQTIARAIEGCTDV